MIFSQKYMRLLSAYLTGGLHHMVLLHAILAQAGQPAWLDGRLT